MCPGDGVRTGCGCQNLELLAEQEKNYIPKGEKWEKIEENRDMDPIHAVETQEKTSCAFFAWKCFSNFEVDFGKRFQNRNHVDNMFPDLR